ncbi:hypothetical protein CK230_10610 [Mesorhizobium sp. WSM3859]|nr:hypothetical protein CK230_10610 [Mesorhizobium sp. WSM3859]
MLWPPLLESDQRTLAPNGNREMQRHLPPNAFYPEDLDVLKRVFDVLCRERGCQPGSPEGEATALVLVNLFESGRRTEEELLEAVQTTQAYRKAS